MIKLRDVRECILTEDSSENPFVTKWKLFYSTESKEADMLYAEGLKMQRSDPAKAIRKLEQAKNKYQTLITTADKIDDDTLSNILIGQVLKGVSMVGTVQAMMDLKYISVDNTRTEHKGYGMSREKAKEYYQLKIDMCDKIISKIK